MRLTADTPPANSPRPSTDWGDDGSKRAKRGHVPRRFTVMRAFGPPSAALLLLLRASRRQICPCAHSILETGKVPARKKISAHTPAAARTGRSSRANPAQGKRAGRMGVCRNLQLIRRTMAKCASRGISKTPALRAHARAREEGIARRRERRLVDLVTIFEPGGSVAALQIRCELTADRQSLVSLPGSQHDPNGNN